jgi:hypothetical protein
MLEGGDVIYTDTNTGRKVTIQDWFNPNWSPWDYKYDGHVFDNLNDLFAFEEAQDDTQATGAACKAKVLDAANNQFGKNYTSANVDDTFQDSKGAPPGAGTLNLNISGSTARVSPGYYPVNWWTYVIGYGSTLHAVSGPGGNGGLDSQQTLKLTPAQGTFHIDSGFPYNPIGLFFHWLLNMTNYAGYPAC